MVRYDERDMFMSRENQRELMERFGVDVVDVPQVFADGKHLGVSSDGLVSLTNVHKQSPGFVGGSSFVQQLPTLASGTKRRRISRVLSRNVLFPCLLIA